MGYYTDYTLSVSAGGLTEEQVKELNELTGYYFGDAYHGMCLSSVKWYDHDENMIEFSKRYPEKVFTLKGDGEEGGDLWVTYYKNGKSHTASAKITFDEFDETKLK